MTAVDQERYLNDAYYHEAVELVRSSLAAELHAGMEDVLPGELEDWTEIIERLWRYRKLEELARQVIDLDDNHGGQDPVIAALGVVAKALRT